MKRLSGYLGTALLSGAVVMLIASDASAQRGRGWGGWGGNWGGNYGGWGSNYYGGWGSGWGGYGYGRGYGYSPYYGSYSGYGGYPMYGRGYYSGYYSPGYYSGYYSPSYDYGYYPSYGGYSMPSYSTPAYGYSTPSYGTPAGYSGSTPSTQDNSVAQIEVRVPDANAEVMFDGQKTQQRGTTRWFNTPPLDTGTHSYRVSAAWDRDGRKVTQERTVNVRAGATATVDFTQGQTGGSDAPLPAPKKRIGEQPPDR